MPHNTKPALELPDALIVRYFRLGEIDQVTAVKTVSDDHLEVQVTIGKTTRTDRWRDLKGGIGYVPDVD